MTESDRVTLWRNLEKFECRLEYVENVLTYQTKIADRLRKSEYIEGKLRRCAKILKCHPGEVGNRIQNLQDKLNAVYSILEGSDDE